jgi:hypothetical protein
VPPGIYATLHVMYENADDTDHDNFILGRTEDIFLGIFEACTA